MKVSNDILIQQAMQAQKKALKSGMIEHYVGGDVKLVPFEKYGMQYFSAMGVKVPLTNGQKIARLRALSFPNVLRERKKWAPNCVIQFCFVDKSIIRSLADEITKEFYKEYGSANPNIQISGFEIEA